MIFYSIAVHLFTCVISFPFILRYIREHEELQWFFTAKSLATAASLIPIVNIWIGATGYELWLRHKRASRGLKKISEKLKENPDMQEVSEQLSELVKQVEENNKL